MIKPQELKSLARDKKKINSELFKKLKRKKPGNLDKIMQELHDRVFAETDCLECANCCKSISPFLTDKDIQRLAKYLRMKPSEFTNQYLYRDEENDYVFRDTPCPFLLQDNYCSVYSVRPKACREYPHTDRKRFIQILPLTLKNTEICPAVYTIVNELHKECT